MAPNELHVTHLPCLDGEEFSLIIPNASTQGPPTSSAAQVNLESSVTITGGFRSTELEARLTSGSKFTLQDCNGNGKW